MTDKEIPMFIDAMQDLGDKWSPEEVKRIYGNRSLADAIEERTQDITAFMNNIASIIK